MNYDPRVLVKLPRSIQNEFPALLTWKLGVSLAVRDFILHNVLVGVPFSKISRVLSAGARKAYLNREQVYLSIVKDIRAFEAALRAKVATSGGSYEERQRAADALSKIRALDFGAFDGDYGGVELKAGYAAFLHMASVFQDEKWYLRKLVEITGKLWVLDHTFKIAAYIMDSKGARTKST